MVKKNKIKISEAEWLVMHVIWDNSPLYMGDIVKALANTPWSRTTIQTMVLRLLSKKIVGTNGKGHAFLYYPLVTREDALELYTKSFVDRVYRGEAKELVSALLEGEFLSAADKKEVKKLI